MNMLCALAAVIARKNEQSQSMRILEILESSGERGMTGRELSNETSIKEHTISARLRGLEIVNKVVKTAVERTDDGQLTPSHVYVLPVHFRQYMGVAEVRTIIKPDDYRRACAIIHAFVNGNKDNAYKAAMQFLHDIKYMGKKS